MIEEMLNRTRKKTTVKNGASGDVNILRSRRTDHICVVTRNKKIRLFISVGDCDKVGRKIGAKECPDGGTHNGTYNAVILEKGERSRAVRIYADVNRGDVDTPLGKNRLIIS